jgi:hypothetical protein
MFVPLRLRLLIVRTCPLSPVLEIVRLSVDVWIVAASL